MSSCFFPVWAQLITSCLQHQNLVTDVTFDVISFQISPLHRPLLCLQLQEDGVQHVWRWTWQRAERQAAQLPSAAPWRPAGHHQRADAGRGSGWWHHIHRPPGEGRVRSVYGWLCLSLHPAWVSWTLTVAPHQGDTSSTKYQVDLGDGVRAIYQNLTVTDEPIQHRYEHPGVYKVKVKAENMAGHDEATMYIQVTGQPSITFICLS